MTESQLETQRGSARRNGSVLPAAVTRLALALGLTLVAFGWADHARADEDAAVLRVCADPDNMPFSNDQGEGFENKLAELIAERLDRTLVYKWFPKTAGYMPEPIGENVCDMVMGYAQGTGLIEDTNPYYYTSYVLITRADDADLKGVTSLGDRQLKSKRIGLVAHTPPTSILAMNGLVANAKPFDVRPGESQAVVARDMIAEIESGALDAGLLWGPIGGYYAARMDSPLTVVPLVNERAGPATFYGITLGVRPNEPQFKHQVNRILTDEAAAIVSLLRDFHVPVLDQNGQPVAIDADTARQDG